MNHRRRRPRKQARTSLGGYPKGMGNSKIRTKESDIRRGEAPTSSRVVPKNKNRERKKFRLYQKWRKIQAFSKNWEDLTADDFEWRLCGKYITQERADQASKDTEKSTAFYFSKYPDWVKEEFGPWLKVTKR